MASTLMAASTSGTVLKPTPFLGQGKGANANPLRDVVSMGTGKYTMVFSKHPFLVHFLFQSHNFILLLVVVDTLLMGLCLWTRRAMNCGMDQTEWNTWDPFRLKPLHTWRVNSQVIMDGTLLAYLLTLKHLPRTGLLRLLF